MFSRRDQIAVYGFPRSGGGALVPTRGKDIYVWAADKSGRYEGGSDSDTGADWKRALRTMAEALDRAKSTDRIFFTGDVREEINISDITDLNLKFDITIQGCAGVHHPDQPGSGTDLYDAASACWRPPASPTATTELLGVYGRGWRFIDILFDCPVDAAAVKLYRNASSGTSEYDSSHARFIGCRFDAGKVGIENSGGASFVKVIDNDFRGLSESGGAGIKCTSTSVAVPLRWDILNNRFHNNASHILSSMSYSTIAYNIFGRFTATLSIDIDDQPSANQGEYNVITGNYLSGTYGATAYPAGSNNEWAGNFNSLSGGVTADDPA
jgi:hypothetical protein